MTTSILADERANATSTLNFFLALGAGGILAWVLATVASFMIERGRADAAGDSVGTTAIDHAAVFVEYWPVVALFTFFFSYLALSVFEREVGV